MLKASPNSPLAPLRSAAEGSYLKADGKPLVNYYLLLLVVVGDSLHLRCKFFGKCPGWPVPLVHANPRPRSHGWPDSSHRRRHAMGRHTSTGCFALPPRMGQIGASNDLPTH